jgi:hypothetical protein
MAPVSHGTPHPISPPPLGAANQPSSPSPRGQPISPHPPPLGGSQSALIPLPSGQPISPRVLPTGGPIENSSQPGRGGGGEDQSRLTIYCHAATFMKAVIEYVAIISRQFLKFFTGNLCIVCKLLSCLSSTAHVLCSIYTVTFRMYFRSRNRK